MSKLEITNLEQDFLLETAYKIYRQRATRTSSPNNYQRISCSFPTYLDTIDTFTQSSHNWRIFVGKKSVRDNKNMIP